MKLKTILLAAALMLGTAATRPAKAIQWCYAYYPVLNCYSVTVPGIGSYSYCYDTGYTQTVAYECD